MIVYFVQRPADLAIKIGCAGARSATGPYQSNFDIYLKNRARGAYELARTDGYLFVERWFHGRHAGERIRGEWFRPAKALFRDVDILRATGRCPGQPSEPAAPLPQRIKVSGKWWARMRRDVFRQSIEQFADALFVDPLNICTGEKYGSSLTRVAGLGGAAERAGISLDVQALVDELVAPELADHVSRYRAHAVRNCSTAVAAGVASLPNRSRSLEVLSRNGPEKAA